MRSPRRIWLGTALLAALGIGAWGVACLLRPREPLYDGKTMSAWVKQVTAQGLPAFNGLPRGVAFYSGTMVYVTPNLSIINLIVQHPAESVPCLIKALGTKDNRLWRPYASLRARLPRSINQHLPFWAEPRSARTQAAALLASMGPRAKAAVPALCNRVLHEPDLSARTQAMHALCAIAPDASDAIPTVVIALEKDPSPDVRVAAILCLKRLDVEPEKIVPALAAALQDPDPGVRLSAAMTLGDIGPQAGAAVEPLRKLISSSEPDATVIAAAHDALRTIGPGSLKQISAPAN